MALAAALDYGTAGTTHHALEDYALARIQPGLAVIAPADDPQAANALQTNIRLFRSGLLQIEQTRQFVLPNLDGRFDLGRAEIVREGGDILIVSIGSICPRLSNLPIFLLGKA